MFQVDRPVFGSDVPLHLVQTRLSPSLKDAAAVNVHALSTAEPRRCIGGMVQSRSRGRQKVVALSSDEEDEQDLQKQSSQQHTTTTTSPTPSPQAKKGKAKGKPSQKPATKTLYSFFNAATQKQQDTKVDAVKPTQDIDPVIVDDISDEDTQISTAPVTAVGLNIKRKFGASQTFEVDGTPQPIEPGRKFLKTSTSLRVRSAPPTVQPKHIVTQDAIEEDLRPWTEKYGPRTIDEVVVHKKKVADVRSWLEAALAGQPYKKMLVLKGPAGSGKTTTLECLAKLLRFSLVEWKNPISSDFTSQDYISISAQFDEFVNRGRTFGGLDIAGVDGQVITAGDSESSDHDQVIVVDDFPHTIMRSSAALQSFRSSLLQCLAVEQSSKPRPIVLIMSESATMSNSSANDNFTAHRLLGPDILHHPSTTTLEFNPVAPTFIAKALKTISEKHRRATSSSIDLSQDVIAKLSEIGDLRNATSTLEYLSLGASNEKSFVNAPSTKSKPKSRAKTKASNSKENDEQVKAALSYIALRESTLGLFHAAGKVLYNKRVPLEETATSASPEELPLHMRTLARSMALEVDISSLMDEAGVDVSTFLSTLHENYALSCYDPNDIAERTLDALNGCLDSLGDADIMSPTMSGRSAVNEGVRQEELAFNTGISGVMLNLPYPVHRSPPPGKGKADAHRMFYPTGLRLWRRREELVGLVDIIIQRAASGSWLEGLLPSNPQGKSISQPGRMPSATPADFPSTAQSKLDPDVKQITLGSGHSARHEMIVERLPYVAQTFGKGNRASQRFKQVEEVTRFTGVGTLQDDEDYDDTAPAATNRTGYRSATALGTAFPRAKGSTDDLDINGLVLSDDDIEDD